MHAIKSIFPSSGSRAVSQINPHHRGLRGNTRTWPFTAPNKLKIPPPLTPQPSPPSKQTLVTQIQALATQAPNPGPCPKQHPPVFEPLSTQNLVGRLAFYKTLQVAVQLPLTLKVLSLLTQEPPTTLQPYLLPVIAPVINYFCPPTIQAIETLQDQDVNSVYAATYLSEQVQTLNQSHENRDILERDLASNMIRLFAIKLTAILPQNCFDLDNPEFKHVKTFISALCKKAEARNKTIILDAEHRDTKPMVDEAIRHLLENKCRVIVTLQATYTDAPETLQKYIKWSQLYNTSLSIKLVKGAYIEQDKDHPMATQSFYETDILLYKLWLQCLQAEIQPIIGSHNPEVRALADYCQLPVGNLWGLANNRRPHIWMVPYGKPTLAIKWTKRRTTITCDGFDMLIDAIKQELAKRAKDML